MVVDEGAAEDMREIPCCRPLGQRPGKVAQTLTGGESLHFERAMDVMRVDMCYLELTPDRASSIDRTD